MEAEKQDRWITIHAPGGKGHSTMRERAIIEIRSIRCDDSEEQAAMQQRPMCPKAVHHTVYFVAGSLDVEREEAARLCGELGIDPSFLLPDEMPKPISRIAN